MLESCASLNLEPNLSSNNSQLSSWIVIRLLNCFVLQLYSCLLNKTIEKSYSNTTSWELFEEKLGLTKVPLYTKLTLMNSSNSNSSGLGYNYFYIKQMAPDYLAIWGIISGSGIFHIDY